LQVAKQNQLKGLYGILKMQKDMGMDTAKVMAKIASLEASLFN